MKKFIVAGIAAAAFCSAPALAADPGFNWTGFYVGAQGGRGWGDLDDVFSVLVQPAPCTAMVDWPAARLATTGNPQLGFSA